MKLGYLILRKITKFVATICQILRRKCTKFYFGWGPAPDPAGEDYSTHPDPLAGFKEGGKDRRKEGGEEKGRGAYRDEATLTKILFTSRITLSCGAQHISIHLTV